jgi:tripartite-type tricarboxylate transporter receptor subunit TctC
LPQLALTFSAGVMAPAGTPAPILDTLHAAFHDALKSPELMASMAKLGFQPEPWTRQRYADFLAEEIKKWPPIVKASGVKAP